MNEQLIKLAEQIREDEPFEPKRWIEISFNYPYKEGGELEWRASYIIGESLDIILEQHNFFANTPEKALNKLEEYLK